MNSREIMNRAIEFRRPDRLPVKDYGLESDSIDVICPEIKPPLAQNDPQLDEWLCRWGRADPTLIGDQGQVTEHPLRNLDAMKDFPWPDGNDSRRAQGLAKKLEDIQANPELADKYIRLVIPHLLWERMWALHGFSECMVDLMDNLAEMHEMADRILEYFIAVLCKIHAICGKHIQGVGFSDDWGTQNDLQISLELWQRFFLPRYRKLFRVIHDCGWHVWFHSCGRINKILPDLIGLSVDVVNMKQPLVNGIEEIGRGFAGKICFETVVDVQKTLPGGNHEEIAAEVQLLLNHWSTPEGGFILCDVADHAAIGSSPENKQLLLSIFRDLDPYRIQTAI